jgi:hypothetical protein
MKKSKGERLIDDFELDAGRYYWVQDQGTRKDNIEGAEKARNKSFNKLVKYIKKLEQAAKDAKK